MSLFKNTESFNADPLCLSTTEELAIAYCCCERGKGISSEVERDTTRCVLFLRVRGGFNVVSLALVMF